jgi:hypothetical protein
MGEHCNLRARLLGADTCAALISPIPIASTSSAVLRSSTDQRRHRRWVGVRPDVATAATPAPHRPQRPWSRIPTNWRGRLESALCRYRPHRWQRPLLGHLEAVGCIGFGIGADDADGADGCTPGFSGAGELDVRVRWIIRVRAFPSRSKRTSMPTLRRKVAARAACPPAPEGYPAKMWGAHRLTIN